MFVRDFWSRFSFSSSLTNLLSTVKGGCSSVTQQNVTYFESPNYPLASNLNFGTCSLTLLLAPYVRQVLIEFQFFELLPPTDGNCIDDKFFVVGQARNFKVPILCGIGSGQHSKRLRFYESKFRAYRFPLSLVYVEVDDVNRRLQLILATTQSAERAFSLKITQIRDYLAPQGCLQFHTQPEGIISTFNYEDVSQIQYYRRPSYFVTITLHLIHNFHS